MADRQRSKCPAASRRGAVSSITVTGTGTGTGTATGVDDVAITIPGGESASDASDVSGVNGVSGVADVARSVVGSPSDDTHIFLCICRRRLWFSL
jgi:hypothetical protein